MPNLSLTDAVGNARKKNAIMTRRTSAKLVFCDLPILPDFMMPPPLPGQEPGALKVLLF